ncbi:MAG: hypothetical protein R3E76_06110 [Planctomycetota bacterium]
MGRECRVDSGIWTDTATYDSMNDETTFYAEPACVFSGHQVGWKVLLNTQRPSYYEIKSVSGSELVVAGDLTSPTMAGAGDWFRIITPYGVDSDNGRLSANPWPTTPRTRTWAGYRYMPPAVGATDLSGSNIGTAQVGGNETGAYHCYNREYDITTGRWTTPDPAASPWGNLQDYVGSRPIDRNDPGGLSPEGMAAAARAERDKYADGHTDCGGKGSGLTIGVKLHTKKTDEFHGDEAEKRAHRYIAKKAANGIGHLNVIIDAYTGADLLREMVEAVQNCEKVEKDAGWGCCCCIENIYIGGHASAIFGGGDYLNLKEAKLYSGLMCKDATIKNYQCFGGATTWTDTGAFWEGLLLRRGGTYTGADSEVNWGNGLDVLLGNVPDPKPHGKGEWKEYKIKAGDTLADLKEKYGDTPIVGGKN